MALMLLTAPAATAVSLDEVKRHLRVETADDDLYLTDLIAASTGHLEQVAGVKLITQTWRQFLDGVPDDNCIRLAVAPVRSLVSMTVYDRDGVGTSVPMTDLELDAVSAPPRLLLKAAHQAGKALNGVEIDIVAGFGDTAADVPDTLRRALLLLIAHAYEFRGAVPVDAQPASEPHGFRTLIAPFRRMAL
ncbi:MAG: head-tail connector protein [Nitratireductor sp.]|nr:head-tail connector protein [Nitratireductor sp.]